MKTLYLRLKLKCLYYKLKNSPSQSAERARAITEIQRIRRRLCKV